MPLTGIAQLPADAHEHRGKDDLPQVLSGTVSETRIDGQYLGHWRVVDEVLMVKFGIDVEAVSIDGMAKTREAIASRVFAGMIDRYVAKRKKAALASAVNSHFRPHTHDKS
jgi:hypothetical protein